ncbi:MAG: DUF47 domain-containing protein [candidate division NC10 bacterium]|nr:DUF47 domain-containing protein [candidate division NC10 bacterium]
MLRIIPREEKFFDMFEEAARNILIGAQALCDMIEDLVDAEAKAQGIKEIEATGDRITHEIIKKLHRTFVTPIDREDIYKLTSALDDVLDLTEAAAARMALFKIKESTKEAKELCHIILKSAEEIVKAITNLRKLANVYDHCVEINRLENVADTVCRDAIARLFDEGFPPLEVIKWKEIYETLETATDRCEDVANIVEGVVLKYE